MEVEEPVARRDSSAFHFHATLPRMLGASLIRDQVVEVRQPRQKRLLAAVWVVKTGYLLKAGQLEYDCRYSKMHGMPVTGGRGLRVLKPL